MIAANPFRPVVQPWPSDEMFATDDGGQTMKCWKPVWNDCHKERWHHRHDHRKWCHDGGWEWNNCHSHEWESHCEKKWAPC